MCYVLATPTLRFDGLTAFGLLAVSLMLAFYAMEVRSPRFVFGFAVACVMGSVYGFLQGAWPFGLVEGVWSIVALRRWRLAQMRARLAANRWRINPDNNDDGGGGNKRGPRPPGSGGTDPRLNASTRFLTERI
jgi:hypothetical protein